MWETTSKAAGYDESWKWDDPRWTQVAGSLAELLGPGPPISSSRTTGAARSPTSSTRLNITSRRASRASSRERTARKTKDNVLLGLHVRQQPARPEARHRRGGHPRSMGLRQGAECREERRLHPGRYAGGQLHAVPRVVRLRVLVGDEEGLPDRHFVRAQGRSNQGRSNPSDCCVRARRLPTTERVQHQSGTRKWTNRGHVRVEVDRLR